MGPRYPGPGGPRTGIRMSQLGNDFNSVSIKKTFFLIKKKK